MKKTTNSLEEKFLNKTQNLCSNFSSTSETREEHASVHDYCAFFPFLKGFPSQFHIIMSRTTTDHRPWARKTTGDKWSNRIWEKNQATEVKKMLSIFFH